MSKEAFIKEQFETHADGLFRYLMTFRLGEDTAYDLVQSVFVKLIEYDERKRGRLENPKAWLFHVGRNMALNQLKSIKKFADVPVDVQRDEGESRLAEMLKDEQYQTLWAAFETLSEKEQELVRLWLYHEMTYAEIGAIIGKKETAARVALFRAKEKLKAALLSLEKAESLHIAQGGGQ